MRKKNPPPQPKRKQTAVAVGILEYREDGKRSSGVRIAYLNWRKQADLPLMCDNPDCLLHVPNPMWNGKAVRLEVDHRDGASFNSRPKNLWLLCPNCHRERKWS